MKIGSFKILLTAAGNGDLMPGTHDDCGMGIVVNLVDVDDIAAVTFEKTLLQHESIFKGVKRLRGFNRLVVFRKNTTCLR